MKVYKTTQLQQMIGLGSLFFAFVFSTEAQGTAFTYQGRLNTSGSPTTGLYDFRFKLTADPLGDNSVTGYFFTNAVAVNNGLFATLIDFGADVINGSNYWLDVEVRTNNPANNLNYIALTPLQAVTPAPDAIFAETAGSVSGPIAAAQISGMVTSSNLPSSPTVSGTVTAGSFSGNGANVLNVNAVTLNGLNSSNFWQLGGNNVVPAQFLGSINNQSVELRVNGSRVMRLEPTVSVPNIVGGFVSNLVDTGAQGVFIGGGGTTNYVNHVSSTLGTITGGSGNAIGTNANDSTIGGGRQNAVLAGSWDAFIGGGFGNTIETNSGYGTIAGGGLNFAGYGATVVGGFFNNASGQGSFIGGGGDNPDGYGAFANFATAPYSVVVGGSINYASATESVVGGGEENSTAGYASVIGGGQYNDITTLGIYATIAGGVENQCTNAGATVSGGGYDGVHASVGNIAGGAAATVGGGLANSSLATYAFIGGGVSNTVSSGAIAGAISGGMKNLIQNNVSASFIGAGMQNIIYADAVCSTIGGGYGNSVNFGAYGAMVPGGFNNYVGGNYSFAAGQQARALHNGAFVWADSQNAGFASTTNDEFSIRAQNGVRIQGNKGIHLEANNSPLIVRDWDVFAANAPANKVGIGRWGLFMEPYNLVIGIPGNDIGARNFQVAKYNTNGTPTMLMQVDQSGNITNAGGIYSAGSIYAHGVLLTSDRNAKENFAALNPQAVLAKVAALPVTEWNYKTDDSAQKHIGPMAQDFQAAFQLSADDKHISVVDEGGVALAAIQGLNQKLTEKEAKINELEKRLNQLEQTLQSLTYKK